MTVAIPRYKSGQIKATQDRANSSYRRRQRELRAWVDQVAESLGLDREQLLTEKYRDLIIRKLKEEG